MKKIIVVSILIMNMAFVFGQKTTLKDYANKEGVSALTISKKMLSFFPKNADISYGGINVAQFVDKLTSINVFAAPNKTVANELIADAIKFTTIAGYEKLLALETKKGEHLNFYIQANEEYISELILTAQGQSKEGGVVQFIGKFTMEDIQQMIATANK